MSRRGPPKGAGIEMGNYGEGGGGGKGYGGQVHDTRALHIELQQLTRQENKELRNARSRTHMNEIREQYFHQKMNLLMQLPPSEQRPYHPRIRPQIKRMGTVRDNVNMEEEVVHKKFFVTLVFIINVAFFLLCMQKNGWKFESTEENPMYGPSREVLNEMGAKIASDIREGEWWRWVTAMFLHAGVVHLLMNMVVLLRLGASMEEAFGAWRVGTIYILSGIYGNVASAIFLPEIPTVGASGALYGLIGALFGDFLHNYKSMTEGRCAYFTQLVISSIVGLVIGLFPFIDNFAHLGGWITGLFAGTAFLAHTMRDADGKYLDAWYTKLVVVLCFLVLVAMGLAGFSVFYSDVDPDGWCSWCDKISCVDTSYWDCDQQFQQICTTTANVTTCRRLNS
eukprot:TRINITY_DN68190_c3_g2_i1.p2 TRINITY_DN68190_c3_g2~~TRINITY_DN68190_c3_g2_i1.p2  ORF type:complete len:395 (+),score=184.44 TRINITY_DN68190_c3_g2_i1:116-1300(+)